MYKKLIFIKVFTLRPQLPHDGVVVDRPGAVVDILKKYTVNVKKQKYNDL